MNEIPVVYCRDSVCQQSNHCLSAQMLLQTSLTETQTLGLYSMEPYV